MTSFSQRRQKKHKEFLEFWEFTLYQKDHTMKQGKDVLIYFNYQPFEQCGLLLTK
jgi:hypothetical protein